MLSDLSSDLRSTVPMFHEFCKFVVFLLNVIFELYRKDFLESFCHTALSRNFGEIITK
jgi:hypothetical protein